MSWIKDNKFVAGLAGGTLAGAALLYVAGSKGQSAYDAAKEEFQAASSEVASYANINPYPSADHKVAKQKSIDEYRKNLESLQAAFDPYRSGELKNVTPEEFTNRLKTVNDQVRKALKASNTKVPDAFYCGFETYQGRLANGKATGILSYQLDGIRDLMLALSKSGVGEVANIHRPALAEETNGDPYQAKPGEVAQALPLELTLTGSEKSLRDFMSAMSRVEGRFVVVRSLRIANAKKDAPKTTDAKFEKPAPATAAADAGNIFGGGGFVLPDEEKSSKPAEDKKKVSESTPKPAPAPKSPDAGRVLSQVLGNEELQMFVRLDILRFLPAQKLP